MDVRLVAYREIIVSSGITAFQGLGSTSEAQTVCFYINSFTFPAGQVPCDIFRVGTKIYNSTSEFVGTVVCCDGCSQPDGPCIPSNWWIRIAVPSNNASLDAGEAINVGREKTFNLDLQEAPNISLNFQFADTKDPEKRKSSYSQTFKLPFTDNNNKFFENWYNVNLKTLNYNTRKSVEAVLYQGATEQFDGLLQLKSVYIKKGLYEVVLISNVINLFNVVGTKIVQEAFYNVWEQYQFKYTYENIGYSWDGGTDLFQNLDGVSFRDTSANVQKVMFPMSINMPGFIYPEPGVSDAHMRMDAGSVASIVGNDIDPLPYIVPIYQFKPAIQVKEIFKRIIQTNGFSLNSDFINSDYFSRLYMTTCNHTGQPHAEIIPTPGMVDGQAIAGWSYSEAAFGTLDPADWPEQYALLTYSSSQNLNVNVGTGFVNVPYNILSPNPEYTLQWPQNTAGLWGYGAFTRTDFNMTSIQVESQVSLFNFTILANNASRLIFRVMAMDPEAASPDWQEVYQTEELSWYGVDTGQNHNSQFNYTVSIEDVPLNWRCRVQVKIKNIFKYDSGASASIRWGYEDIAPSMRSKLSVVWTGYFENVYDKTVNTCAGIDPSLTQKDFLKDIIQRFNLVIVPDATNPTRLYIEPYDTFMASGSLKNWTDKVDISKEITIKDTLSMQKRTVEFTDSEDEDLVNKSIKEFSPLLNVYGNYKSTNVNNQFAQGEQKYQSPFSPYMNEEVFKNQSGGSTAIPRMVVQYETSYDQINPGNFVDIPSPKTKPKLFYYSGKKTNAFEDPTQNYYLHGINPLEGVLDTPIVVYGFTDYPLCTAFELEVEDGAEGTITTTTKSLYWNSIPPALIGTPMFNYAGSGQVSVRSSLFYTYWARLNNRIYNTNTKIVECSINLNAVDILNFNFNDQIFIKDQYYQILQIKNYIVGQKQSAKVTMMTITDDFAEVCIDCHYVISEITENSTPVNTFGNRYIWCDSTDEDCIDGSSDPMLELDLVNGMSYFSLQTSRACCHCAGGMFTEVDPTDGAGTTYPFSAWTPGNGYCIPNANSLPIELGDIYRARDFMKQGNAKRYITSIVGGYGKSLATGTNRDKFSYNILPEFGDDIKIQYSGNVGNYLSPITGESHRLVLIGKTTGTTKGYAYINGVSVSEPIYIPYNSIVNLRVKGISTVIGGASTSYPLGSTEAFAYYTAFKNEGDATHTVTQLGTANGTAEYSLKESALVATCTLEIDSADDRSIRFGLKDADSKAVRLWQLTVDYDVNIIPNMGSAVDKSNALYEDYEIILFENEDELLWN